MLIDGKDEIGYVARPYPLPVAVEAPPRDDTDSAVPYPAAVPANPVPYPVPVATPEPPFDPTV